MPGRDAVSAVFPAASLRAALMHSPAAHRPELADLAASDELDLDYPGLWLRTHDSGVGAAWLELRLAWIRVLPGNWRGREA